MLLNNKIFINNVLTSDLHNFTVSGVVVKGGVGTANGCTAVSKSHTNMSARTVWIGFTADYTAYIIRRWNTDIAGIFV